MLRNISVQQRPGKRIVSVENKPCHERRHCGRQLLYNRLFVSGWVEYHSLLLGQMNVQSDDMRPLIVQRQTQQPIHRFRHG